MIHSQVVTIQSLRYFVQLEHIRIVKKDLISEISYKSDETLKFTVLRGKREYNLTIRAKLAFFYYPFFLKTRSYFGIIYSCFFFLIFSCNQTSSLYESVDPKLAEFAKSNPVILVHGYYDDINGERLVLICRDFRFISVYAHCL